MSSIGLERLKKDRDDLTNYLLNLELQINRAENNLKTLNNDYSTNNGAMLTINKYIDELEKSEVQPEVKTSTSSPELVVHKAKDTEEVKFEEVKL